VDLLDGSKQRQGQSALWGHPWFGHGYSHLRLGSNRLHQLPFGNPLVGCGQRWHHRRIFLLVPRSHSICETTLSCFFRISCSSEYRILQYTNVWYSAYLPLVSSDTFDNTGKQYNVSQIINSDSSFNLQAYEAYSPIFLPASFAISYGLSFATISATITHTFLYYRKYIWTHARRPFSEQSDIHARLMSVYKEVPDWWYLTIFGLLNLFIYLKKCMLIHSQ
jgi:OPT oligopeptide transporter protein